VKPEKEVWEKGLLKKISTKVKGGRRDEHKGKKKTGVEGLCFQKPKDGFKNRIAFDSHRKEAERQGCRQGGTRAGQAGLGFRIGGRWQDLTRSFDGGKKNEEKINDVRKQIE